MKKTLLVLTLLVTSTLSYAETFSQAKRIFDEAKENTKFSELVNTSWTPVFEVLPTGEELDMRQYDNSLAFFTSQSFDEKENALVEYHRYKVNRIYDVIQFSDGVGFDYESDSVPQFSKKTFRHFCRLIDNEKRNKLICKIMNYPSMTTYAYRAYVIN